MATETPPGDGAPEPDALRVPAESDTPLPLRTEADAAVGLSWYQQLSQPQVSTHLPQGGLVEPLFAPPVHVEARLTGVEATAEAGNPSVIVNRTIAAESGEYKIEGNAPGLVVKRAIGRAGARNRAAVVQITALSFLTTVLLKLEAMRTERLNSEDAAIFESLKVDIEAFLAANATSDETSTAKATNSIAKGLRRYWESEAESISGKMLNTP